MSHPIYLHCRSCVEEWQRGERPHVAGTTALVFDGDLMILCNDQKHDRPVHMQRWQGPPLVCEHCESGDHKPELPN